MKELQKVSYTPEVKTQFTTLLENAVTVSPAYLKELKKYEKELREWKHDVLDGQATEDDKPMEPEKKYGAMNNELLAFMLPSVQPVYASSEIGLPVIYNHETRIYEQSIDDLESRLWNKLYGEWLVKFKPEFAMDTKVSNQFRQAVSKMAKNARSTGANLPFNHNLDPNLIAFRNGTYRFKEDTLTPTTPEDYQTVRIEYDYKPDAKHNIVADWIEYILEEDALTLFQLIGRIFYRSQDPQVLVFATGEGSNGKSKVMAFIESLVGSRNVSHATLESLSNGNDRFSSAQLFGKMVNIETDMSATHIKETGLLKSLSGDDMLSAEFKGVNKFNFVNYALMIFTTNNMPTFSDSSDGFKRRVVTLPFNKRFHKADKKAGEWLERSQNFTYDEKSEFISFCIKQYRDVLYGLNGQTKGQLWQSEHAIKQTNDFIENNNMLEAFVDDYEIEFTSSEEDFVSTSELLELYNSYLLQMGYNKVSSRKLIPDVLRQANTRKATVNRVNKRINGTRQRGLSGINVPVLMEEEETNNIF